MIKLRLFFVRVFTVVMLSVFVIACSEDEEITPAAENKNEIENPDLGNANHQVYAAYNESINDVWVAKILTACGPIDLSNGVRDAQTSGLAYADGIFYTAGYEDDENGVSHAKYWRNSESIMLESNGIGSIAQDIAVVDEDVYVAGYIGDRPVYWKNGEVFPLSKEGTKGVATCIFVSGKDVYVGGAIKKSLNTYEAVYWVNGEEVKPGGTAVHSIFVKGSDVYVTGKFGTTFRYLKNGAEIDLKEASIEIGTNSIFVDENDKVYVGAPGIIWAQGERTSVMVNGKEASFSGLKVLDGYMYGAMMYYNGSHYVAAYWKNGEVVNITDGTHNAGVSDIVVIKM